MSHGTELAEEAFDAEQLHAMGIAFEKACESLGLTATSDRLTDVVADKIIEMARLGEADPARLYAAVMHWASAA
jgi:hypothetical protein